MLLTNARATGKVVGATTQPVTTVNTNFMMMGRRRRAYRPSVPTPYTKKVEPVKPVIKTVDTVPKSGSKRFWGPAVWYFFHTIVEKVKDDHFVKMRREIITWIVTICKSLPCPACSEHSNRYLSRNNIEKVATKDELKMYLFVFHNNVNERLGNEKCTYEECDEKYKKGLLVPILNNFLKVFLNKHHIVSMMADDTYRHRQANSLREWFRINIDQFDL